ncbi:MAG: DNA polymerase III subunit beta [Phycisphaerales bacterium]|jgi:DNA polymerase-3 subunit beta|nr:DNA polymerase III subunit beta [Phycisphaerales bacterium]
MTVKQATNMKAICDRDALADAMSLIAGVVPSRTPTPSRQCVLITAGDGQLQLAATDGEISLVRSTTRVDAESSGQAFVPADKVSQIVRSCDDPTMTLSGDDGALLIRSSDSRFKVFAFPISEASDAATFEGVDPSFVIGGKELHLLIDRTLFAAATDHSRYAINGVLFERKDGLLRMVATNGHRLAMATASCDGDGEDRCIIPTKTMTLLRRLLGDGDANVAVHVDDGRVLFHIDDEGETATISSNLVEGNFPPYEDVVPKDLDRSVRVSSDALNKGIRRAALLTNEESRGVRMVFEQGRLVITGRSPEMGEAEIEIPLDGFDGEPLEIGFNPAYILDAMKVVGADEITIELKRQDKPGLFRSGDDFLYIIMPVNLS